MTNKHIFTIVLFCSVLLCSALFCSADLNAQCTVHGITNDQSCLIFITSGGTVGQTFQACESGEIKSIAFPLEGSDAGTHEFRIAAITAPATAIIGGPVYQTFTTSGGAEIMTITLNPPFPVTAGNDYAFELKDGSGYICPKSNFPSDYPNGFYYDGFNGAFSPLVVADLDFEVAISPAASPAAAAIPTVGEWGLLILALLFMTLGTLYLVQPNVEERIGK